MITGTIAVIFFIGAYCCGRSGEWTGCIIGIVIGLFMLFLGACSREQDRAYNNVVEYWAKGGPDRKR